MAPASPHTPDLSSPSQLKAAFRSRLNEWDLNSVKLKMLDAVLENWLEGDQAEDVDHFRQRHRRHIGPLDDLLNRQLVTHGAAGKFYDPRFLAFCLLLVNGNRTAVKLRLVMDRLFRLVKHFLAERPIRLHRSTTQVREQLPQELRPLLLPAVKLLSEPSTGISLGSLNTPYPDLNFSDNLLRYNSPTQLVWNFLKDHRGNGSQYFVGMAPVVIPFELTRLQVASEAHASATKAVNSLASSPDTAVSQARAALEACFKQILGPGHPRLEDKLPRQSEAVLKLLQLRGEFSVLGEQVLGVMKAIGDIRNKFGDDHGHPPGFVGVTRSEAQLTVGTALHLCEFLLERWEAVRSIPQTSLATSTKAA